MTDLHQLLGLLREPGQEEALDPQPGLGDLDQLIAETRAAGVDVEMTVTGEPPEVGGGIGLSVYRVVQEALTNVAKHAPDASAGVYVHYAPDEIRVRVADGGSPARRRAAEPGGRGLVGMRERAALFGGELTAGPGPEGGFVVEARFPAGRGTGS